MKKIAYFLLVILLCYSAIGGYAEAVLPYKLNSAPDYSFQQDYDAIERKTKSVFLVHIIGLNDIVLGYGSGFVAFNEHVFITNQHVIDQAQYLVIESDDNRQYSLDQVLMSDKAKDLAILAFPEGKMFEALQIDMNASLRRGQRVTTIGSPKGLWKNTVAFGNISAFPEMDGKKFIQFTAPISQGSSGGALFDDDGQVIGVTSAVGRDAENVGLAIPIQEVVELYNQWDQKHYEQLGTARSWDIAGTSRNGRRTAKPNPVKSTPTVSPSPRPTVSSTKKPTAKQNPFKVTIEPSSASLKTGAVLKLNVRIFPVQKGNVSVKWTSGNPNVVSVEQDGSIHALKEGKALIYVFVYQENDVKPKMAYCEVAVTDDAKKETAKTDIAFVPLEKIEMNYASKQLLLNVDSKDSFSISLRIKPGNATISKLVWSANNPQVVSVSDNGRVKALKAGKAIVTVTAKQKDGKELSASCEVTVKECISKITDKKTQLTLYVGESKKLAPTIIPKDIKNKKVKWNSSNSTIIAIDGKGNIKAKKAGKCTVTCTAADEGGVSLQYSIVVYNKIKSIKLINGKEFIARVNEELKNLSNAIQFNPSSGINKKLNWKVKSNNEKPSLSKQFKLGEDESIKFYYPGIYKLTATTTDGSKKSATLTFHVVPENRVTLYFPNGSMAEWEDLKNNKLRIRFQVSNYNSGLQIKAFELYAYATDVWGNNIYNGNVYYWTTNKNVKSGGKIYSDYVTLPNRNNISKVYCGIHKIMYSNGEIVELDNIDYASWTYK